MLEHLFARHGICSGQFWEPHRRGQHPEAARPLDARPLPTAAESSALAESSGEIPTLRSTSKGVAPRFPFFGRQTVLECQVFAGHDHA